MPKGRLRRGLSFFTSYLLLFQGFTTKAGSKVQAKSPLGGKEGPERNFLARRFTGNQFPSWELIRPLIELRFVKLIFLLRAGSHSGKPKVEATPGETKRSPEVAVTKRSTILNCCFFPMEPAAKWGGLSSTPWRLINRAVVSRTVAKEEARGRRSKRELLPPRWLKMPAPGRAIEGNSWWNQLSNRRSRPNSCQTGKPLRLPPNPIQISR